jgi:kinesin family protein 15
MKKLAEEKNEYINVLQRSIDDLESTVCALEERLESTVCARSNSMHSERSALIEEIDATNRNALAAKSKENEDLRHQLDEALLLNGMKDKMLEDLGLLQVNNAIPVNGMEGLDECHSYNLLTNCHHETVMSNTITNDIETIVLASELKQHKAELQEHMLMCAEVLEGLKTKEILWKFDQELGSVIIDDLLEDNSNIKTDLENLKRSKDEIANRAYALTTLMCSLSK